MAIIGPTVGRPRERVPVEHRWLGLDKRSLPYALFVIGVFLVATVLVPRIDDAISWDDPVQAGEQLAVAENIAFSPTAGWNVVRGLRVGEDGTQRSSGAATVVGDGITFNVTADSFDGTPAELLNQIAKVTSATSDHTFRVDGEPATITTPGGATGVVQTYSSVTGDGLVAAFVIDGVGVAVTAYGPPTQMAAASDDIDTMIASIRTLDATGRAS